MGKKLKVRSGNFPSKQKMTIAGLYMSPEGIVLGADSTSTVPGADGTSHFFDFTQKVFEVGEDSTVGMVTWGLGGLGDTSYRTLLAVLSDQLKAQPAANVNEVAQRWSANFWPAYKASDVVRYYEALHALPAFGAQVPAGTLTRTEKEEKDYVNLGQAVSVGFCFAGYLPPDRKPEAATVIFHPLNPVPAPHLPGQHSLSWWGVPNFLNRLLFGIDPGLKGIILSSPHWTGAAQDLDNLVQQHQIAPGILPIRDAIDYVYSCIHCTIKAMKFSTLPQMCGGPIEVAVITTDRKFRWVRHKSWDSAIIDGENHA